MGLFKVICIDDKNKPLSIPQSSWIKRDEVYTVTQAANMAKQNMVVGFKLAEVELPADIEYEYYISTRFRPFTEDDAKAEEAVEALLLEAFEVELI